MSTEDREFIWRHAFAYADCHTNTDDAIAYATHYVDLTSEVDDMNDLPAHGPIFAAWYYSISDPN